MMSLVKPNVPTKSFFTLTVKFNGQVTGSFCTQQLNQLELEKEVMNYIAARQLVAAEDIIDVVWATSDGYVDVLS